MSPATQILAGWLGLAIVMTFVWLRQRRTGNAGTVDVAWTFGLGGLSYQAGQRLGAIELAPGLQGWAIVALGWGAAMVALTRFARLAHRPAALSRGGPR